MKAIYPKNLNDIVTHVNGDPVTNVALYLLPMDDSDFFYSSWDCGNIVIGCENSITSMDLYDGENGYNPTISAFVGGRPPHPPKPIKF